MDTTRFLDDLRLIPESLERLARALESGLAGIEDLPQAYRALIVGMGSSLYAATPLARIARASGSNVAAELASTVVLPPPDDDLVVIAISATGNSAEVLHAVLPYQGHGRLVAVTNSVDSELARRSDVVVPLHAGFEASGVACRTFRHTALVLAEVLSCYGPASVPRPADLALAAAESNSRLFDSRGDWLADAADTLAGPHGTWTLAPVERLASAQQSALMMREVPRRFAQSCETGDWAHVDVYLTKTLDYRALVFAGSIWDSQAIEWMHQRGSTFVSVGADLPGAALSVRYPGEEQPLVAAVTEIMVGELVAHTWLENASES